jgi:hypothetical protein
MHLRQVEALMSLQENNISPAAAGQHQPASVLARMNAITEFEERFLREASTRIVGPDA